MADISSSYWATVDANNNAAAPNGWTPGVMLPSQVEPTAQAMQGAIKRFWERVNCQITTTGSSGTYVYTPTNVSYPASIAQGEIFGFYAHQTSAGNDTFKINGTTVLGPYNIYLITQAGSRQIKANEIQSGQFCLMQYSTALGGMVLAYAADISSYSPTFSGTVNMASATSVTVPTLPVGTNTNQAASMAALIQQAFSTSLPAQTGKSLLVTNGTTASWAADQTGNSGKFLTTNGTNPSWGYANISTINSTVTTSTTISGTNVYVPVQMSSIGQSVTLPNATTLSNGGPQYILDNTKGGYPAGIRDNTGVLLMAVSAGGEAYVSLKDNSTQAGVWSVTGSNLEPGLITIDSTFSSTYASSLLTALAPFAALDSNTSIHFAALSSGFAAFVVDNAGKVVSTPVTVDSTASSVPKQCFKIDGTHAIVFYGSATNILKAAVLTLTGSSPSFSISVGTPANSGANTGIAIEDFTAAPKIAQLDTNLFLVSWATATGAGNTSVMGIQVSGVTTVNFGSKADIIAANNILNSTQTYKLTTTTAAVLYKGNAATPFDNNAVVVSVTNANPPVCTVATPAAATSCQSSSTSTCASAFLSSTKIAIADDNNTTQVTVSGFTFSGTTTTPWTALNVETGLSAGLATFSAASATRYNPHIWLLSAGSSNTAGLWYLSSSNFSRSVVITESSGTVTQGTKFYNSICSAGDGSSGNGVILPQGATEFCSISEQLGSTAGFGNAINAHKISGSTITQGYGKPVRNTLQYNPNKYWCTKLSQGDYLLLPFGSTNASGSNMIPVFRTNGDAINYRGEISCPMFCDPVGVNGSFNTGVSSNRCVYLGPTLGSTINNGTSYQPRLLNVEIAQ